MGIVVFHNIVNLYCSTFNFKQYNFKPLKPKKKSPILKIYKNCIDFPMKKY